MSQKETIERLKRALYRARGELDVICALSGSGTLQTIGAVAQLAVEGIDLTLNTVEESQ